MDDLLPNKSRLTHLRDVIVHTPPAAFGYEHISGEWYDDGREVRECFGFEDKSCADQWRADSLSFADHLTYLNVTMICQLSEASPLA